MRPRPELLGALLGLRFVQDPQNRRRCGVVAEQICFWIEEGWHESAQRAVSCTLVTYEVVAFDLGFFCRAFAQRCAFVVAWVAGAIQSQNARRPAELADQLQDRGSRLSMQPFSIPADPGQDSQQSGLYLGCPYNTELTSLRVSLWSTDV